ncbi:tonB-dependent Receptor Plug domain protein, partial [Vibrio parahaemolyticus VP2007-007]
AWYRACTFKCKLRTRQRIRSSIDW